MSFRKYVDAGAALDITFGQDSAISQKTARLASPGQPFKLLLLKLSFSAKHYPISNRRRGPEKFLSIA